MQRKYFGLSEDNILLPLTNVEINTADYTIVEDANRWQVSEHRNGFQFLIDFGYRENTRSTIICNDAGQMVHAMILIKQALGGTE